MNTFVKTAEVTRIKALQLVSLIAYRRARLPAPVRLPAVPYSDKLNIITISKQ